MTPVSRQPTASRRPVRVMLTALAGLVLLAALLAPARDPVTHALTIEWRPSAELAGLLFVTAMAALARPQLAASRAAAVILALLVAAAALLNLAGAATPTLLGRDLNLYWDLRH